MAQRVWAVVHVVVVVVFIVVILLVVIGDLEVLNIHVFNIF